MKWHERSIHEILIAFFLSDISRRKVRDNLRIVGKRESENTWERGALNGFLDVFLGCHGVPGLKA